MVVYTSVNGFLFLWQFMNVLLKMRVHFVELEEGGFGYRQEERKAEVALARCRGRGMEGELCVSIVFVSIAS